MGELSPNCGFQLYEKVFSWGMTTICRFHKNSGLFCKTVSFLPFPDLDDIAHLWLIHGEIKQYMLHIATCNTLQQRITTHCNTLEHITTHRNTLQHVTFRCNTLQHIATHCNTLHHIAPTCVTWLSRMCGMNHSHLRVWHDSFTCLTWSIHMCCDKLTHCNSLQHTATHCNTLQHICHDKLTLRPQLPES